MPDGTFHGSDFADHIESVARRVLGPPNAQKSNRQTLRWGTHGSMAVEIAGDKKGTWFDHEANHGGGVLDLLRIRQRLSTADALHWLAREVGGPFTRTDQPQRQPFRIPSAPAEKVRAEPARGKPKLGRIVATYDYHDADGVLLFQVVRHEPKDFRQRRPDGKGGWIPNTDGIEKIPYRLPDILDAFPLDPVYIVEGEKDADALHTLGLVVTCNAEGAGKWQDHFAPYFKNRHVAIMADNDEPGRNHAQQVARNLIGTAATVRIIDLPGLPPKGDVSDWLAAGGTAEALEALRRAAPDMDEASEPPADDPPPSDDGLPLLWFEDIREVTEANDFVQGVLAERSSAVVYGESNAGKTFWTTDLALHVAAGKRWNDRRVDQGGVIYCALEGGIGFGNRLAAWRRRHCEPGAKLPFAAVPVSLNLLDPDADAPRLVAAIKAAAERMGMPVKLVVVDTLSRALAGGNENASEDMGALVRNMDQIREARRFLAAGP